MKSALDENQLIDLGEVTLATMPVAVLQIEPDELMTTRSLRFREGYDDLDSLVFATLSLPSGREATLVRHTHSPNSGTEICVLPDEIENSHSILETVEMLGLTVADLVWIHPDCASVVMNQYRTNTVIGSMPERAKTLKEAFRACDLGPLMGENLGRYYVDLYKVRDARAIAGIGAKLSMLEAGEYTTLLLTGHRGCGKSTELQRIRSHWQKDYRVIYLEADSELDINNAEYTDLYLTIFKKVSEELAILRLSFDPRLLTSFESWFKEVTQETKESVERSISTEVNSEEGFQSSFIFKLLTKLTAQIKGSDRQRRDIRQSLQHNISRLQNDLNLLLEDAHRKLKENYPEYAKGFLVIVDNLDRVPPNVANHLFFDYGVQLQSLNCTLIYTVPISVLYSEQKLSNVFDSPNIMPMVNMYQFEQDQCDLAYSHTALVAMSDLIEQRVEVGVFESKDVLLVLAKASGGHVRQLMQMMRNACLAAISEEHTQISHEDAAYAIKQEQFDFERIIPRERYRILAQVCLSKDCPKDEIGSVLLFNTSVLEYNGTQRWNYVNPVVKYSDAFQKALKAIQADQ
jgi:energy-coupling factor transporter ATP-binding protein EcfA2